MQNILELLKATYWWVFLSCFPVKISKKPYNIKLYVIYVYHIEFRDVFLDCILHVTLTALIDWYIYIIFLHIFQQDTIPENQG